jgi:hypothetical protein
MADAVDLLLLNLAVRERELRVGANIGAPFYSRKGIGMQARPRKATRVKPQFMPRFVSPAVKGGDSARARRQALGNVLCFVKRGKAKPNKDRKTALAAKAEAEYSV